MKSKIQNPKSKILLALLALLALPMGRVEAAPTAQTSFALAAKGGFGDDGSYVMGEWFPVRITLSNPAGAPSLRVRVEVDSKGPSDTANGSYGREVDLPGQSRKEVTLYSYAAGFSRTVTVRVLQGSTVVKSTQVQLNPIQPSQLALGAVSSDASLLNVLKGEKAGHVSAQFASPYGGAPNPTSQDSTVEVLHMGLPDIPPLSPALNGLGTIVLEDAAGALSEEQAQALTGWVARGGTLIVAPRPGGSDVPPAVAGLLPVKLEGTRNLNGFKGLGDLVAVSPLETTAPIVAIASSLRPEPEVGARELASQEGIPLVAARNFGEGQVVFLALSPGVSPVKNWDGIVPLFQRLLAEHRVGPSVGATLNQAGQYYAYGTYGYGGYGGTPFEIYGSIFDLPGLELPSALLVTFFMLVYIIIIGPVNFIILRRRRRPELAWVTIPALVLIFSVGAYILGYGTKGGDLVTIRARTAYAAPELDTAQAMQVWGIFSPNRGTYRLNVGADSVVSQFEQTSGAGPSSESGGKVSGGSNATSVDDVFINTGSLKGFAIENTVKAGSPLEADLHLDGDTIVGTVRNRSGGGLQDVALVRGGTVQYIGYMGGGGSSQVRLHVTSSPFDNSSPTSLLPTPPGVSAPTGGGYGYYAGNSTSTEQRKYNRKIHTLNLALQPLVANEPPVDMDVLALAWGADVPVSLSVDGHLDRAEDLSLWTTCLHVTQQAAGRPQIPSGQVPYSAYVPKGSPAWLPALSDTNISLQPYADLVFRLPAGAKPDTLQFSIKLSSSPHDVDLMAYNLRTGGWDRLGNLGSLDNRAQSTEFTGSIPNPADYAGPAGDVTLRLLSTTGKTDLGLVTVHMGLNAP